MIGVLRPSGHMPQSGIGLDRLEQIVAAAMDQWDMSNNHNNHHAHAQDSQQPTYFGNDLQDPAGLSLQPSLVGQERRQAAGRAMAATYDVNRAVSRTPSSMHMSDDVQMLGRQPKRRRTGEDLSQEARQWQYGGVPHASSYTASPYGDMKPSNSPLPQENYTANPMQYGHTTSNQPQQYGQQPQQNRAYASPWQSTTQQQYGASTTFPSNQHGAAPMNSYHGTLDDTNAGVGLGMPLLQGYQYPGMDASASSYSTFGVQPQGTGSTRQVTGVNFEDASMHLKLQSLPSLENLVRVPGSTAALHACQIPLLPEQTARNDTGQELTEEQATQLIQTLGRSSITQLQELMSGSDHESVQAYTTVKNLFDQTRKVYTRGTPFIDANAIHLYQPQQQEAVRKANIATFVASILGAHDVSFSHLNAYFLETFIPQGLRLLKWQGVVLLELKTQAYIYSLLNSDVTPQISLDELFPADLEQHLLSRHPDAPSFSPSEQDFIDRVRARKNYLHTSSSSASPADICELPKKYQWNDFVREFAFSINKNVDSLLNYPVRATQPAFGPSTGRMTGSVQVQHTPRESSLSFHHANSPATSSNPTALDTARNAFNRLPTTSASPASATSIAPPPSSAVPRSKPASPTPSSKKTKSTPPHSTAPSTNPPTIRQPWTKPEEDALLSGLSQVSGPHWSQILALYGRGGSQSEVLKDRNQVQLKDKARNLKLWYLKTGREVPVCLRGVTGELRKRGGARVRAALGLDDEVGAGSGPGEGAEGGGAEVAGTGEKGKGRKKK